MKILYNSSFDQTCPKYNLNGNWVNEKGLAPRQMQQYLDDVAEDMKSRWGFLEEVNSEKATKILEKNKKEAEKVKVESISTEVTVDKEIPNIDPDIIPVDNPQEVKIEAVKQQDGTNAPEFYGPGLTETFEKVPPLGKGHF